MAPTNTPARQTTAPAAREPVVHIVHQIPKSALPKRLLTPAGHFLVAMDYSLGGAQMLSCTRVAAHGPVQR